MKTTTTKKPFENNGNVLRKKNHLESLEYILYEKFFSNEKQKMI